MNRKTIKYLLFFIPMLISQLIGQWQQSVGTENLDMQAIISHGNYDFAGGATGTYRSSNESESYIFSNSGNDSNGPTRAFTFDFDYIYTGTSQGVFRSDNNGELWESKSNGLTSLLSHGLINVNSKLIHVSPFGVSLSNNQGDNWISAGLGGYDVRCITNIEDTLFVGTNGDGLFKSIDWGNNWIPINNGSSSSNFRAIESKGDILFAGGQNGTGVFRSSNFGASWELLSNGIASSSFRGFAINSSLVVAGSTGAGVFYSLDEGDSWNAINDGLPDLTIFDLAINGNYIIAATHSSGVFRFELSNIISTVNGDLNGDNLVNVLDVIATVNLVLNGEFNILADLNDDSQINVLDILLIVNIILNN
jgi:hypothetical protein